MFDSYASKLKKIIENAMNKDDYETALAAISSYGRLAYEWNQFYIDEYMESCLYTIAERFLNTIQKYEGGSNTVLFYDGFGMDTRGLALIYLEALVKLGFSVIYVTDKDAKNKQPEIDKVLSKGKAKREYINCSGTYCGYAKELASILEKNSPSKAFLYTRPDDVCGALVFRHYKGKLTRYQINLTDHAFWLGRWSFDICIEFREYGAGISYYERQIPLDRLVILPYYPWVNRSITFHGFSFPTEGKKILFSGGALYKTLGGNNQYYLIVDKALKRIPDMVFIYAGNGDDRELKKLIKKWPGRVFHVPERKDLLQLMEHVDAYLNTYPMEGGLMVQYAAMAGVVPVSLVDRDFRPERRTLFGIGDMKIEFYSVEDVVNELEKIMNDQLYQKEKSEKIKRCVIDEEHFKIQLKELLDGKMPDLDCPERCNTEDFLRQYRERFGLESVCNAIGKKQSKRLVPYFPWIFVKKVIIKCRGLAYR